MVEEGSNPFIVTTNSIGSPQPPTPAEHQLVKEIFYRQQEDLPLSVWNMVANFSQLVSSPSPGGLHLYGEREADGRMNFDPYTNIQKLYEHRLFLIEVRLNLVEYWDANGQTQAYEEARISLANYLENDWDGGIEGGRKGLKNIVAQSRIASSYGLLQMLYPTAIGLNEPLYTEDASHLPEDLNITNTIMTLSMIHQKKLLIRFLGKEIENNNKEWDYGYEESLRRGVYRRWNSRRDYPKEILEKSLQYLPRP